MREVVTDIRVLVVAGIFQINNVKGGRMDG